MKSLSAIILITFFSAAAFAQDGTLDSTFSGDGKVSTAIGQSNDLAYSVAVQADGKIVATGYSSGGTTIEFALVRYNEDGSFDSTFNTDGKVTTAVGGTNDQAYAAAIQPDGKIVAAGFSTNGPEDYFALVRYNTDGSLDSSFSTDGKVTTAIGLHDDKVYSITIQPDGKIVVAGYSYNGSNRYFALARYNANGTLDNSFSTDGKVTTVIGSNNSQVRSLALQTDGKIVAGGNCGNGSTFAFALVRYTPDGTLDNSFGSGGKVITDIGSGDDVGWSAAIQPDGKIVQAGYSYSGTYPDFALVRYNTDGTFDNSFGNGGKVTTEVGATGGWTYAIAIQPDGKIIEAGTISNGLNGDFALVRYNIDGTPDSSFGNNGKVTTEIGLSSDVVYSLALEPDGKIVAAGYLGNTTEDDFALARYLSGLNIGILNFSSPQPSPVIYPNPIHQNETLEYTLTQNESLTIALYDVNGKLIRNFISNEERASGAHKETLNIGEVAPGNYFLTVSNGSQKMTVKVVKQ
ncbi:MAG TPA: T9SS type A sorting domain-containing protein [Chitinophagales bacterium]|nr:T9SS type A sorting domain-containing protein [Chitinophagales bacterium]